MGYLVDQDLIERSSYAGADQTCSDLFWMKRSADEILVYTDPSGENVWGINAQTPLENFKKLIQSIHPADRKSFEMLFNGERQGPLDYRLILPNGVTKWMQTRCFSIRDNREQALYIFGTTIDITERRFVATTRKNETEQKASFLSVVSHELRTPLQPILGYLYLMLDDPNQFGLNEESVQFLNAIQGCANRMTDIISRVFSVNFSDAELKLVQPRWEEISLERLVMNVVRVCNTEGDMTYTLDTPPVQSIETDWGYLYEALYEICTNVVRYSDPPHHVIINYDEDLEFHIISISDNGPGMDEKTLQNLFQPFYIGDRENLSRACGRLGLGLTIAKRDVEILGGAISVDSALNQGSTFTIRLPKHPNESSNT